MKVLIATGIYPPDVGGPATWAELFASEFTKRGHNVSVLTYSDNPIEDKEKFFVHRVLRTSPKGVRHLKYLGQALRFSKNHDLILVSDTVSAGLPVCLASFLSGRPFVLKIGGDYAWEQGMQRFGVKELLDKFLKNKYGFRVEIIRSIQSFVARRAKAILAPSEYLASVVEKWGIPRERISVIYNSVKLPDVSLSKIEAREKLGVKTDEVILFSAGREVPWKGLEILKEIFSDIGKTIPKARLVAGTFPKEEYWAWLQAADIYLLNTGYEGFSHQILEAMAMGLPVITTDAGGNKEIVKNEENALVVKYNDKKQWAAAIERLINDDNMRNKISKGAKATAQKFINRDIVGETIKVLEKVL